MSESLLITTTVVGAVVGAVVGTVVSNYSKVEDKAKIKTLENEKSEKKKKKFITLTFFGTTNNYQNDVNPYDSIAEFMANSVGSLKWGTSAEAKRKSKIDFAYNFHRILDIYNVCVASPTVADIIRDDATMLNDVIDRIVEQAAFP
jgi:hypothetical protein